MAESKENPSFIDHLSELRVRIIKSVIPVLVFAVVIFVFFEPLSDLILKSMLYKEFPTYRMFCNISQWVSVESDFCTDIPVSLREDGLGQQFSLSMWFSIVGGLVISIPWIIFQIWQFIKPGLKKKEVDAVQGFGLYVFILLFLGICFGYFMVAPLCINFFGNYDPFNLGVAGKIPSITSYYRYIINPVLGCSILFQLPVAIYLFSKLGIMNAEILKKYRKHVLVGILILAAIITPPDFVSQVIVAIPVFGLYEISILISKNVMKNQTVA
ncbi:MAG: twin-arginine translocase subunit TatC [Flavobacteriales bacterium]